MTSFIAQFWTPDLLETIANGADSSACKVPWQMPNGKVDLCGKLCQTLYEILCQLCAQSSNTSHASVLAFAAIATHQRFSRVTRSTEFSDWVSVTVKKSDRLLRKKTPQLAHWRTSHSQEQKEKTPSVVHTLSTKVWYAAEAMSKMEGQGKPDTYSQGRNHLNHQSTNVTSANEHFGQCWRLAYPKNAKRWSNTSLTFAHSLAQNARFVTRLFLLQQFLLHDSFLFAIPKKQQRKDNGNDQNSGDDGNDHTHLNPRAGSLCFLRAEKQLSFLEIVVPTWEAFKSNMLAFYQALHVSSAFLGLCWAYTMDVMPTHSLRGGYAVWKGRLCGGFASKM